MVELLVIATRQQSGEGDAVKASSTRTGVGNMLFDSIQKAKTSRAHRIGEDISAADEYLNVEFNDDTNDAAVSHDSLGTLP